MARLKKSYPSKKDAIRGFTWDMGSKDTICRNVEELLGKVVAATGRKLDHVVSTVGDGGGRADWRQMSVDDMLDYATSHFFGPLVIAQHAQKYVNSSANSSLTFTSGSTATRPGRRWVVPAAFTGGLSSMTRALALDLAPIRINLVQPGLVDTARWSHLPAETKDNIVKQVEAEIPTERFGRSEDVAEAYLYCWKDGFINGACLETNGGYVLVDNTPF